MGPLALNVGGPVEDGAPANPGEAEGEAYGDVEMQNVQADAVLNVQAEGKVGGPVEEGVVDVDGDQLMEQLSLIR